MAFLFIEKMLKNLQKCFTVSTNKLRNMSIFNIDNKFYLSTKSDFIIR